MLASVVRAFLVLNLKLPQQERAFKDDLFLTFHSVAPISSTASSVVDPSTISCASPRADSFASTAYRIFLIAAETCKHKNNEKTEIHSGKCHEYGVQIEMKHAPQPN